MFVKKCGRRPSKAPAPATGLQLRNSSTATPDWTLRPVIVRNVPKKRWLPLIKKVIQSKPSTTATLTALISEERQKNDSDRSDLPSRIRPKNPKSQYLNYK